MIALRNFRPQNLFALRAICEICSNLRLTPLSLASSASVSFILPLHKPMTAPRVCIKNTQFLLCLVCESLQRLHFSLCIALPCASLFFTLYSSLLTRALRCTAPAYFSLFIFNFSLALRALFSLGALRAPIMP